MGTEEKKEVEATDQHQQDEGEVLSWTVHPMRRKPWVALLVTVFIFVVSMVAYMTTASKAFGTLALVVLFASLAKFYMPTTFRLSDKRIMIKSTTQTIYKNWLQFRSFYPDKNGVLLSPFSEPSRLESFRGIFLIFDRNKDEVVDFIKPRIGRTADASVTEGQEQS